MTSVLIGWGEFGHKDIEEYHVKMKAETGVIQLQAKECQELKATSRS